VDERRTSRIWRPQDKNPLAGRSRPGRPCHAIKGLALVIGIVLLVLAGCGPAPDAVAAQLVEAVNSRDLDGALALFARDAVVDTGSSAPFSGMGEIRHWLERLFADNVQLGEVEILEQDENRIVARYPVTMDSASALGVASLEGSGEMTIQQGRITALSFSLSAGSRAELLRATLGVGSPLLSYAVLTDPDPLRASPGGGYEPNLASLTVVVTNDSGAPVQVRSIILRLPEGSGAGHLTPNISGINSEVPDRWHLTKKEGRFTLAPELAEDGILEVGEGLFIALSEIEVNDRPGVWGLEIVEETGEATAGSLTIPLTKFPFELYVSDLGAMPLIVEPGGSTTLYWEGSDGATYRLYDGQSTTDVPGVGSYTVDGLMQTTTFYLTATLVGGEDQPPVIRERTVTVKP
jgi:SnoaL-like domain